MIKLSRLKTKKIAIVIFVGIVIIPLASYFFMSVYYPECGATIVTSCDEYHTPYCVCSNEKTLHREDKKGINHLITCEFRCIEEEVRISGGLTRKAYCEKPSVSQGFFCEGKELKRWQIEECITQTGSRPWIREYKQTFKNKTETIKICNELCEDGKCVCIQKTYCKDSKIYTKTKNCEEIKIKDCPYGCKNDKECAPAPLPEPPKTPQQEERQQKDYWFFVISAIIGLILIFSYLIYKILQ